MNETLRQGLEKAGIRGATKHVFLCIGPDCCAACEGEALWEYAKRRVHESGVRIMRTKAACFRICTGGPWMVVYPDGVWYGNLTPERFERILQEHIVGGNPVREWIVAENSLQKR